MQLRRFAISGITGLDVEIIDESLMRIAVPGNTGICSMRTWPKMATFIITLQVKRY